MNDLAILVLPFALLLVYAIGHALLGRWLDEPFIPENDDRHEHEETEPIEKW